MRSKTDQGFTLIELLIVVAIISIIAAIAVPGLLRARMTGNETSAIASLKAMTVAQVAYSTTCGNGAYASSLPILHAPPGGSGEGFINADLGLTANPIKAGYTFALVPGAGSAAGPNDCNGTATITTFYVSGTPLTWQSTGARAFATNASSTIWYVTAAAAPVEPFGAPAAPIQ